MHRLLLSVAVLISTAGCASRHDLQIGLQSEPTYRIWWERMTFIPHGTQVRGIPVKRIDPAWCKANELTEEAFPASVRLGEHGLEGYFGDRSDFSAKGVFGGQPLEILLGIYQRCDGRAGTFLLVLAAERPTSSPDKIVQVESLSTRPVFIYLHAHPPGGTINTPSCFQCDHIAEWRWDARAKRFVPQPEPDFG